MTGSLQSSTLIVKETRFFLCAHMAGGGSNLKDEMKEINLWQVSAGNEHMELSSESMVFNFWSEQSKFTIHVQISSKQGKTSWEKSVTESRNKHRFESPNNHSLMIITLSQLVNNFCVRRRKFNSLFCSHFNVRNDLTELKREWEVVKEYGWTWIIKKS